MRSRSRDSSGFNLMVWAVGLFLSDCWETLPQSSASLRASERALHRTKDTRLTDLLVFDAGSSSMFLQLGFQSRACTIIKIMVISGSRELVE